MNQLTMKQKLFYAMGGLSLNLANLVISQWLLKLYVPSRDEALVPGFLFAAIFLLGRVVDGITEPIAGFVSDHHRSRRGRRIPFIMVMTLPAALITFLLWVPPVPGEMHWANAVWVFVLVQLFFICWSLLANPYMALLPEITTDLNERVNISTYQAVFLMIGTLIFGVMGPIKDTFGWAGIGLLTSILTIASFIPTMLAIKEKPSLDRSGQDEKMRLTMIFQWAGTTFHNRPFRYLLAATAVFWFGLNMIILIIPFWTQYVLGRSDRDVVLLMAPLLAANIIFFFIFNYCARRFGKYFTMLITFILAALTMPLLWFVSPGADAMLHTQIVMALIGMPVAGIMILPFAILSDVIDHDETLTGRRREGIYVGVQAIFQKISIGISIAVATGLMYFGGDLRPTETGLKLISAVAGGSSLLAFVIFLGYPIRERKGRAYIRE